ncbi:glycoside hydrolase family 19 protein [Sphingomonas sp. URHD0057]|uniref:glycoside hydrolase family 19 protein n=1 Tax=Sphingomonas sp. URHD0057 TaxID=1380389 RepID=UPI00055BF60F|nr:glycoside hydrolase family 19 protein [Sphingomonas sp. URHD0057]
MSLADPKAFFDLLRTGLLGPVLTAEEVKGCNAVLEAMEGLPISYVAYALATAYHETASTMQPIREYGGTIYFTRMYDVTGARPQLALANGNTCAGDGPKYCGRGYVQLTWKNNYDRASKECGVDLVAYPDKAMNPDIAAKIMRSGMEHGWFTGKSFKDYLPIQGKATRQQFLFARYIINGRDKADKIADHAIEFQRALDAGGWE